MTAFIFDVDGTIAETEHYGHRIAFNRAFTEAGLNWYWYESLYGELLSVSGGKERIHHYIKRHVANHSLPHNLDRFVQNLHRAKNQHYQAILQEGNIPLRTGIKRLLTEAKAAEIRLAIATTSSFENTIALLNLHLQTDSFFEIIAAGDIVSQKKPAPDIYLYVLEKMDLSAEDCLVFEDSYQGLTAATKAGLKTVVTFNNYTKNQDFSEAILVLNHLGETTRPFTVYDQKVDCQETYFNVNLGKQLLKQ